MNLTATAVPQGRLSLIDLSNRFPKTISSASTSSNNFPMPITHQPFLPPSILQPASVIMMENDPPLTTIPYVIPGRLSKYSCPSPPLLSPVKSLIQTEMSPSKESVFIGVGVGELTVHSVVGG